MEYVKGECSHCGKEDFIVNKTHKLCQYCNQERLHGKDWKQKQIEKQKAMFAKSIKRASELKPKQPIKSKKKSVNSVSKGNRYRCSDGSSVTQQEINAAYKKTIAMIDQTRPPVCESCGRGDRPLSHSHIISKKRAKELGKAELIYDENNILLECYDDGGSNSESCHNIWEYGSLVDKQNQSSYDTKLTILREYDEERYRSLT